MPNDRELKAEIGHVLFIEIAGYSKRLINEQIRLLETLRAIVRTTAAVRLAKDDGSLIQLPTGEGVALVFRSAVGQAVDCALEIGATLRQHRGLPLRMGIHSGPIDRVLDENDRSNVAGAGIDGAQQVTDCGDAGHILLSQRTAEDLAPDPRWNPHLHDLGEIEVKPGAPVHVVNLFTREAGNPATPSRITKKRAPLVRRSVPHPNWLTWLYAVLIVWSLGGAIWWFGFHLSKRPGSGPGPAPAAPASVPALLEKSIAVLPFESLSEEKANTYFADGMQNEILINLARIADLKVISRSSVMQYRSGGARGRREIGRQLGVATLLEGSAQRSADKVRVIARLIDLRTDAPLWTQTYDRDLADVFAIQSEIAQAVAGQLKANVAPNEAARLATSPTKNMEAYLLYLQANETARLAVSREDAVAAEKLYVQAIALDPNFALLRARASIWSGLMYLEGRDPVREANARALAEGAVERAPDLPEGHLALGLVYYRIDAEYDRAQQEFAIAGAALPNSAEVPFYSGQVFQRQGRWQKALAAFVRARELDPRSANFSGEPNALRLLRQWPKAKGAYERGLRLEPQLVEGWLGLANVQFASGGDAAAARAIIEKLPEAQKETAAVALARMDYAMLERDFAAAEQFVPLTTAEEFPAFAPVDFYRGTVAFARGDRERAQALLGGVRAAFEQAAREHPDEPSFRALLGRIYALLGEKKAALREAQRAVELCPESKDAVAGPDYSTHLAFVHAQTGDVEAAVTLLARLLTTPAAERVTLAHLRLSWEWDPLRDDPRFQQILAAPEPATAYR